MPRAGHHPLKIRGLKVEYKPKEITIATVVYIPSLEGYWEEALDVLKVFFYSLFQNTTLPFDLMVLDNGSCPEVKQYLQELHDQQKIQYLIFSEHNLMKLGGLNFVLCAAPGEIISFMDSDVYLLPGWLEESLKVLEAFPEAGKVTAQPLIGGHIPKQQPDFYKQFEADPTVTIQSGLLIPEEYVKIREFSLDRPYDPAKAADRTDILLSRGGVEAYLTGSDFQFTTRRDALQPVLPLNVKNPEVYNDPIYSPVLEYRLDKNGRMGLSTRQYLVHHMGNRIPALKEELNWVDSVPADFSFLTQKRSAPAGPKSSSRSRWLTKLLELKRVRDLLKKINTLTYRLLFEK